MNMKRRLLIRSLAWLLCTWCIHLNAVAQKTDTLQLSLDDALYIAFSQGETLRIDSMEVAKVKESRRATIAKLWPQINASADYSYTIKKQVMYLGGGKMPAMPGMGDLSKGIEVGRSNNITAGISAALPVIAPQLWNMVKLSKQQMESMAIESEISRVNLTNNVTKAFYGLQLAWETVYVMQQSLQNAQLNFEDISKKYDAGLVPYYDKLRAEVQVHNLEPNYIQAKNAVEDARRTLNILLGIAIDTPIKPIGTELTVDPHQGNKELYSSLLINSNNSEQPYLELIKADQQIAMLKTRECVEKSAFIPTLSLSGFFRVNAMDDTFKFTDYRWTPFSAVQLTLSIPLFSGFERSANLRKAKLTTHQAMLQRDIQKKQLDAQAQSLAERLAAAEEKISSAEKAVSMATTGYEIANKRYDTGASTLVELNDADLALLQSRLNLKQAYYDYFTIKADIDKLNGKSYKLPSEKQDFHY